MTYNQIENTNKQSHMYNYFKDSNFEELNDGRVYIYVLKNFPQGNIKIGRSTNITQRLISLSGSNGGGNKIVNCFVSEPTYLYSLEKTLHNRFHQYRIDGTEWFDGSKLTFEEVCITLNDMFESDEYARCNEIRRRFYEAHGINRPSVYKEDKENRRSYLKKECA